MLGTAVDGSIFHASVGSSRRVTCPGELCRSGKLATKVPALMRQPDARASSNTGAPRT
jgi:hypothetical protein